MSSTGLLNQLGSNDLSLKMVLRNSRNYIVHFYIGSSYSTLPYVIINRKYFSISGKTADLDKQSFRSVWCIWEYNYTAKMLLKLEQIICRVLNGNAYRRLYLYSYLCALWLYSISKNCHRISIYKSQVINHPSWDMDFPTFFSWHHAWHVNVVNFCRRECSTSKGFASERATTESRCARGAAGVSARKLFMWKFTLSYASARPPYACQCWNIDERGWDNEALWYSLCRLSDVWMFAGLVSWTPSRNTGVRCLKYAK